MRRLAILATVVSLIGLTTASAATADQGAFVWVDSTNSSEWGFEAFHTNPCTGEWVSIEWWAEHHAQIVDTDGDLSTMNDQHKNSHISNTLWAVHSEGWPWIVETAWSKGVSSGWTEDVWFGDEDQATVHFKVRLQATNVETREWYQTIHHLRWVSTANGTVIHGEGSQTNTETGCKSGGLGYLDR